VYKKLILLVFLIALIAVPTLPISLTVTIKLWFISLNFDVLNIIYDLIRFKLLFAILKLLVKK